MASGVKRPPERAAARSENEHDDDLAHDRWSDEERELQGVGQPREDHDGPEAPFDYVSGATSAPEISKCTQYSHVGKPSFGKLRGSCHRT